MKKSTLVIIPFLFFIITLSAQKKFSLTKTISAGPIHLEGKFNKKNAQKSQRTSAVSCGNDTIFYTDTKTSGFLALSLVGNGQGHYGEGLGQWYDAPQPVTIHGFVFYGRSKYNTNTPVNVSVYSAAAADSTPNTLLATATTTLNYISPNSALAAWQRNVNFTSPVTVTGPYLVVVEAPASGTDTIQLITNNNGDAARERLSKLRVLGNKWIDVADAYGLDADFYSFPIVSYNLSAKFSVAGNLAANQTISFTNTSSPIFFSRFYNLAVLLDKNPAESFLWNFGDGSPDTSAINISHVYANSGSYNVKLSSEMYGYSINCLADTTAAIVISSVLPVKLTTWKAKRKENEVLTEWSTATEYNNKGFELQRSADGTNFSTFTFVESKAYDGYSSVTLEYEFTDANPPAGDTYYRLKQVDKDGKSALSNIVLVKGIETDKLVLSKVYPNPAKSALNIVLVAPANDKLNFIITDLTGKLVMQQAVLLNAGNNNISLNVSKLAAGSYMIKAVCTAGCETLVTKFVKQ